MSDDYAEGIAEGLRAGQAGIEDVVVVTRQEVERWVDGRLRSLGLTREELDAQAEAGAFSSDGARRLWMALP